MKHLPKKLVYHFYANKNTINSELNKIHLNSLKLYSKIFDSASVTICVDDVNDKIFINDIICQVNNVLNINEIDYHIKENTPLYETKTFCEEVLGKLKDEYLIFFAHNKGATTEYKAKEWIECMYFLCLDNIDTELDKMFISSDKPLFLGAFKGYKDETKIANTVFPGTFFWINCKQLLKAIDIAPNILEYSVSDRYFAEDFPKYVYDKINLTEKRHEREVFVGRGENVYEAFFGQIIFYPNRINEVFEYIIGDKIEDFKKYAEKSEGNL